SARGTDQGRARSGRRLRDAGLDRRSRGHRVRGGLIRHDRALALDVLSGADAVGGADQDLFQAQRLGVLAAPETLVADEDGAAVREGELTHRLVLLLVRG